MGISEHSCDAALFDRLNIPRVSPAELAGRLGNESADDIPDDIPDETPAGIAGDSWTLLRDTGAEAHLTLRRADKVSLSVDFTAGKTRHRSTESGHGAQSLIRAIGVSAFARKHGHLPRVIDATGGLCQDAWALASAGCELLVIEQHPVVHALVEDALQRASDRCADRDDIADTAARVRLVNANAATVLLSQSASEQNVIYLDPMYPARRKSAASKKGMQFLQLLLGPATQQDDAQLLGAALGSGVPRVVVKRPKGAEPLAGSELFDGQRTVIESPNTRYDIYISHENSDTA